MSTRLEEKLAEYEKHDPISNDEELIKAIEIIIEAEEKLPADECDYALIEEAVDAVLMLKGEDIDALEMRSAEVAERHLAEVAKGSLSGPKVRFVHLKRILPIAAIISLVIIGSLVASAMRENGKDAKFEKLEEKFSEQADISSAGEYYEFTTLDELINAEAYMSVPKPMSLPEGCSVNTISVQHSCIEVESDYLVDYTVLEISLRTADGEQTVVIENPAFSHNSDGIMLEIDGKTVYCREADGKFEGSMMLRGFSVTIRATKLQTLRDIVRSMN
ncbi:MAG: hypothetical protein IJ457_07785 [Clostridia bacterium]|nr:hypothetical protein [Clostridia bacterium]